MTSITAKDIKKLRRLFTKGTPLRTLAEQFDMPVGSIRWHTRDIPAKFSPKTDPDFFRKIGKVGGEWKGAKGFAVSGKASSAGVKGGTKSRRGKAKQ